MKQKKTDPKQRGFTEIKLREAAVRRAEIEALEAKLGRVGPQIMPTR